MVVCTRAFIERNRINQHALQSSVYFLFVWTQLMTQGAVTVEYDLFMLSSCSSGESPKVSFLKPVGSQQYILI